MLRRDDVSSFLRWRNTTTTVIGDGGGGRSSKNVTVVSIAEGIHTLQLICKCSHTHTHTRHVPMYFTFFTFSSFHHHFLSAKCIILGVHSISNNKDVSEKKKKTRRRRSDVKNIKIYIGNRIHRWKRDKYKWMAIRIVYTSSAALHVQIRNMCMRKAYCCRCRCYCCCRFSRSICVSISQYNVPHKNWKCCSIFGVSQAMRF